MTGLPLVAGAFGALMLASAAHSAARLLIARLARRSVDAGADAHHLLMGISLAGILLPGLGIVPAGAATAVWTAVWAAATAWPALDVLRRLLREGPASRHARGRLPHLAMSAAMLYVLASPLGGMPPGGTSHGSAAMPAMASDGPMIAWPTLDLVLLALMAAYTVTALEKASSQAASTAPDRDTGHRTADAAANGAAPAPGGRGSFLAPRRAHLADAAMGLAMAYTLAMMLA